MRKKLLKKQEEKLERKRNSLTSVSASVLFDKADAVYKKNKRPNEQYYFINQRENWDCGVSSLAMVTNQKYNKVRKDFQTYNTTGISVFKIKNFLSKYNINCKITKPLGSYTLKELLKENKTSSIILIKKDKYAWGHYIVIDKFNNIYDSETGIHTNKYKNINHLVYSNIIIED